MKNKNRLQEIKDIPNYNPVKLSDMALSEDWRLLGAQYSILKDTGNTSFTEKQIIDALVLNLSEIIKRGKITFHSKMWKENPRELYLEGFRQVVDKGISVREPHGKMISEGTKKAIVKSKKFIPGNFYLLVSGKNSYGFIRLEKPTKIGLKEFKTLSNKHQISEPELASWLNNKKTLYYYPIRDFIGFKEPTVVNAPADQELLFDIKLKHIAEARNRRDQCMECSKVPVYEALWAEGIGHAWFCEEHFKKWSSIGDGKGDINSVKEIKEKKAAGKFKDNTNPNIWDLQSAKFKEQKQAMEFDPTKWNPGIYLKATEKQLIKLHDKLLDIWISRGKEKGDKFVIDSNASMISELTKRSTKFDVNELDKIVKADLVESDIINGRAHELIEKIRAIGPVVWMNNFVSQTGSDMLTKELTDGDADWAVKMDQIPPSLVKKLKSISLNIMGTSASITAENAGPNYRWLGLYDLVLVPKKDMIIHEVDTKEFRDKFYKEVSKEVSGKYTLRKHSWQGSILEGGQVIERWDLLIDTGKNSIDMWIIENNPIGSNNVNAIRKSISSPTPSGKGFKEWMKWEGPVAPNTQESWDWEYKKVKIIAKTDDSYIVEDKQGDKIQTRGTMPGIFNIGDSAWIDPIFNIYRDIEERGQRQGNPKRVLPAFIKIVDSGDVKMTEEPDKLTIFKFDGKELKGKWIMELVEQDHGISVFKKDELPKK